MNMPIKLITLLAALALVLTGCPEDPPDNSTDTGGTTDTTSGDTDNTTDTNTGDTNTGDTNTGDTNTGDTNTGDTNTGDTNTGDTNTDDTADTNTGAAPDPAATAQIEGLAAGTPGSVSGAAVSYVKPSFDPNDPQGFFVQAEPGGAAIFIEADPTAPCGGCDAVNRGDIIDFTADTVDNARDEPIAVTALSALSVTGSGYDVRQLASDITSATDVVSAIASYQSQLISVDLTVASDVNTGAGPGYDRFDIETTGLTGNTDFQLRVPEPMQRALGLEDGCVLTVTATPMWRFRTSAQVSFWRPGDVTLTSCPTATDVESAQATSATEVMVTFTRAVDMSTVAADGSDFTMSDGLNVTGAALQLGNFRVLLTTDSQTGGNNYTVTVGSGVQDVFGQALSTNTADFLGFESPAVLRINEVNANVSGNCDLVEFRVITGGTTNGFVFQERDRDIYTFPAIAVQTNDYIVLHLDSADCNASGSADETDRTAPNDQGIATHSQNYEFALDLYATDSGLTSTDNAFIIKDAAGTIQDGVIATEEDVTDADYQANNNNEQNAAASSESGAADLAGANEWTNTDGSQPAGGYVDDDFHQNAVYDLKASSSAGGDSIQRSDNNDNNHAGDWGVAGETFGGNNAGQTDL